MPTVTAIPTSTKVVEEWLKSLTSLVTPEMVGPTLPSDKSTWAASGFWQVTVVGGSPSVDIAELSNPVVEVSCWAATTNAEFPPYNRAEAMAQAVRNAAQQAHMLPLTVASKAVRLMGLNCVTEPRRIPDPGTGFARVSVNIECWWAVTL